MRRTHLVPLFFALFIGCNGEEDGAVAVEDPLSRYAGACQLWAEKACIELVTDSCGSNRRGCLQRQAAFCVGLLEGAGVREPMDVDTVEACAGAVEDAYDDARLDLDEYKLVMRLEGGSCGELERDGEGGGSGLAPVGAGMRCEGRPATSCVPGFYCDGSHCIERVGVGQACCETDGVSVCAPGEVLCVESAFCGPEGVCLGEDTQPQCYADDECRDDQVCVLNPNEPDVGGLCMTSIALNAFDPTCNVL